MARIGGLHLLFTYQCTHACDHCFVFGSPDARGTMTAADAEELLGQAGALGSVKIVYFEGGEPFLFYPLVQRAAERARQVGFEVGLVTNGFWAVSPEDARTYLEPFVRLGVVDFSVSTDYYHAAQGPVSPQAECAARTARDLGLPVAIMVTGEPGEADLPARAAGVPAEVGGVPVGGVGSVRYRGRAALRLAGRVKGQPWTAFASCPYERLEAPGRVHVDALGYVHICQGLCMGNWREMPLADILGRYRPAEHPVVGPLLAGGPAALARAFGVDPAGDAEPVPVWAGGPGLFADACHLCYHVRSVIRTRVPEFLAPSQMYGGQFSPPEAGHM